MIKVGPEVLADLEAATSREWVLADGLGGYASSTVIGLNTRRYHGLLVAATHPPVGRMVLLSRLDETLVIGHTSYELATRAYPGVVGPRGHAWATSFVLDPLPTLSWEVPAGARLTRTVARVQGAPGTVLVYRYEGLGPAVLELRPFIAYRDHHGLQRENDAIRHEVERQGDDVVLRPYEGCPPLWLRLPRARWESSGQWYRQFEYAREQERGLEAHEDLFTHGAFRLVVHPGETLALTAWAGEAPGELDPLAVVNEERKRLRRIGGGGDEGEGLLVELRRAATSFVVRRGEEGYSIVAGYHWFADWGRDAMIALPGLCLGNGRHREARAILLEFARHVDEGLVPNRFPDDGETPEYNAADAALWLVVAIHHYQEATGDREFVNLHLRAAVTAILEGYRRGTRHGIHLTPEGLVSQGEAGVQLTWMDAKAGGHVVTPRRGYAVEIQALWYNALQIGAEIAKGVGDELHARDWSALAIRARESFLRIFWSDSVGYLADVVSAGTRDLTLRPNQLYAVGLPHALLPRDKAGCVVEAVRKHLLTPVGLRTLAPDDPAYHGRHGGDARERDEAYHQGTVWPFLMGVYFDAVIRVYGEQGKVEARAWLAAFEGHLEEAGLGTVSEVFDGDPPHRPSGAISQAWSVAELLRIAERLGRIPVVRPPAGPRARGVL
jgi:predicted glycogen debranching enzyme